MPLGIDFSGHLVAPPDPLGDGAADIVAALDRRILGKARHALLQLLHQEIRHVVARLADGHVDGGRAAGRHVSEQPAQARERRDDHRQAGRPGGRKWRDADGEGGVAADIARFFPMMNGAPKVLDAITWAGADGVCLSVIRRLRECGFGPHREVRAVRNA